MDASTQLGRGFFDSAEWELGLSEKPSKYPKVRSGRPMRSSASQIAVFPPAVSKRRPAESLEPHPGTEPTPGFLPFVPNVPIILSIPPFPAVTA